MVISGCRRWKWLPVVADGGGGGGVLSSGVAGGCKESGSLEGTFPSLSRIIREPEGA